MHLRRLFRILVVALVLAGIAPAASQADEQELMVNGDFSAGVDPWTGGGGLSPEVRDGHLCADLSGTTVDPWEASVNQTDIPIEAGQHYRLRLTAWANTDTSIMASVTSQGGTVPAEMVRQPQLTSAPQTFEYVFTAEHSAASGSVRIRLGAGGNGQPWTFCMDDVSLASGVPEPPATGGQSFIDQFDGPIDRNIWYVADGFNNGSHQNCQFNQDNATTADGILTLTLDDTAYGDRDYSCAEIQTHERYSYGTYETRMKVADASGTNSSLFSYIGGYHQSPHMEIDFEALGKDPTGVEVNSWVNGSNRGPWPQDIGYDASRQWVDFAYVWEPNRLRFYINGQLVKTLTNAADIPSRDQFIFTMLWGTDTLTGWMGPFEYPGSPITAQYDYVAFTRAGDPCQFEGSVACGVEAPTDSFVDDFDSFRTDRWFVSDGWNNGADHNCTWDSDQVSVADGTLNLSFAHQATGDRDYACAEVQHRTTLGYGTYEARLKGVAGSGLLSSMFTWVGADGESPSEAIDMAKLFGVDPGSVTFDVHRDDQSLSPTTVDLASPHDAQFTDYGVDWSADRLDFYVNGDLVASVTDPAKVPDREAKLFFSIWGSDTLPEFGEFEDPGETVTFQIDRFAYTEPGDECQFAGSIACTGSAANPNDEFDGAALDTERWTVLRPDTDGYRVANGNLEIDTSSGDIYSTRNSGPKNFVLQDAPDGDWTIETKVDASTFNERGQQASLIAYLDESNYVRIGYITMGGDDRRLVLRTETDDVIVSAPNVYGLQQGVWYLRLSKVGDVFTGSYSADGTTWTDMPTTVTNDTLDAAQIGLAAYRAKADTEVTALFDYFHVSEAGADTTAPTVDVDVVPTEPSGGDEWWIEPAVVSAHAADDAPGNVSVEYRIGDGAWADYAQPLVIDADGVTKVELRATDAAGNVSEPVAVTIRKDSTAPVTVPETNTSEWSTESVEVGLSASDATAGVAGTEWSLDGSDWSAYEAPVLVQGDGVHELRYRSTDAAGNVEDVKAVTVSIDGSAPILVVGGIAGGELYGDSQDLFITWEATDATSGVARTVARLDGNRVRSGEVLELYQLPLGMHKLRVVARDEAGNRTVQRLTFFVTTSFRDMDQLITRFDVTSRVSGDTADRLHRILTRARLFEIEGRDGRAIATLERFKNVVDADVNDVDAHDALLRDADAMIITLGGEPLNPAAGIAANDGMSLEGTGQR